MPIFDPQAMGLQPCTCGRIALKMHCPKCGCYSCEARARYNIHRPFTTNVATLTQKEVLAIGRQKLLDEGCEIYPVYKCRRCANEFDETQWGAALCNAPVYESGTARKQRQQRDSIKHDMAVAGIDEQTGEKLKEDIFGGDSRKRIDALQKLFRGVQETK